MPGSPASYFSKIKIGKVGVSYIEDYDPFEVRKRTKFTNKQCLALTSLFSITNSPTKGEITNLGKAIGLSNKTIQVWFQNKRAKERKNLKKYGSKKEDSGYENPFPERDYLEDDHRSYSSKVLGGIHNKYQVYDQRYPKALPYSDIRKIDGKITSEESSITKLKLHDTGRSSYISEYWRTYDFQNVPKNNFGNSR